MLGSLFEAPLSFADRLSAERNTRGMSRRAMAKLCAVSATTIGNWEGGSTPQPAVARRVIALFGWDMAPADAADAAALSGPATGTDPAQGRTPLARRDAAETPQGSALRHPPVPGQTIVKAFPQEFDRTHPNFKGWPAHRLRFKPAPPDDADEVATTLLARLDTVGSEDLRLRVYGERTRKAQLMRTEAMWRGDLLDAAVFSNPDGKPRAFAFRLGTVAWDRGKRMTDPASGERLIDRKARHRRSEGKHHHDVVNQAFVSSAVLALDDRLGEHIRRYEGTTGPGLSVDPKDLSSDPTIPNWFPKHLGVLGEHYKAERIPVRARILCHGGREILICRQPFMAADNEALLVHFPAYDAFLSGWYAKHDRFTGSAPPVIVVPCEDEDHALDLIDAAHPRVTTWTWPMGSNMHTGKSPSRDRLIFLPQTWLDAGNLTGMRLPAMSPEIHRKLGGANNPRVTGLEPYFIAKPR